MISMGADWAFKWSQRRSLRHCQEAPMRQFLQSEFPPRKKDFKQVEYLATDLEMTGMDASKDHILSIGFVPIIGQKVILTDARHIFVSSDQGVGQSAVIHGIHDRDLEKAASLNEAMAFFLEALKGRVLLLHCAKLDLAFLQQASQGLYNSAFLVPVVDTMALENQRLQRTGVERSNYSLRLSDCRKRYNLPDYAAHNALIDAVATAELFLAQMSHRFGNHFASLRQILVAR